MIPVAFEYARASSVDDAIAKLAASGAKAIAGGHSLVPLMKLRLSEPGTLVDISRIPGLSGIRGFLWMRRLPRGAHLKCLTTFVT